jgi:HAMP domain-containing protein
MWVEAMATTKHLLLRILVLLLIVVAGFLWLMRAKRLAHREAVRQAVEAGRLSPEQGRDHGVDARPGKRPAD